MEEDKKAFSGGGLMKDELLGPCRGELLGISTSECIAWHHGKTFREDYWY